MSKKISISLTDRHSAAARSAVDRGQAESVSGDYAWADSVLGLR